MFEVSFVTAEGNLERHIVRPHWMARQIARKAIAKDATDILVRLMRVDLWAINPKTGNAHLIYEKITPTRAALISRDWLCNNRAIGLILWPSEQKTPKQIVAKRAG
jgi:hypothetical protein